MDVNPGLDLSFIDKSNMPNLNYLDLSRCALTTIDMEYLITLENLTMLEYLIVRENLIMGLRSNKLKRRSTLKFLDLRFNPKLQIKSVNNANFGDTLILAWNFPQKQKPSQKRKSVENMNLGEELWKVLS
jgi:Leucine-rich repeat (LRR) protein